MESKESQISVWVCQEEKLVLGLSKRTTCADVVQVLLEEQKRSQGLLLSNSSSSSSSSSSTSTRSPAGPQSYCLVEKWRGLERVLPLNTRILRLWTAWGEERSRVRFVLVRNEAAQAARGARCAEARVVPSSAHGPRAAAAAEPAARAAAASCAVSPEKQRRVVRKAFRKLEKMNRSRRRRKSSRRPHWDEERMETLVHLVLSQDHTIRQQLHRLSELDQEIERCEAQVHLDRVQRHGVNYLQDMYLTETFEEFEDYVRRCEELVKLQEQLWEQEALADVISLQVQEELNQRWMQRRRGELPLEADTMEDELLLEAERVRTQLEASSYIGLRLNTDLEAIRSDLELTQEICVDREKEMRDLLEKVNSLELGCQDRAEDETGRMDISESKSEWVEQARGLGKTQIVNDDDSDTGLSSLHSQDSDTLPVWESLV